MNVIVVASGDLGQPRDASGADPVADRLGQADLVIAADGGLVHCAARDVWPDVVIGDMDSAPPDLVEQAREAGVEVVTHPSDKDATDLELAIELGATRGASGLHVLGLFGGRVDHELANVSLLASSRWASIEISGGDGLRTMWVVRGGQGALSLHEPVGTLITLIPWGRDVAGVTTTGLRWPLAGDRLPAGSTRGVSNVCTEPLQRVSAAAGTLVVVADRTPSAKPQVSGR